MAQQALDLALVLAIDCSGSISNERLLMQIDGYSGAFRTPELVRAIEAGRRRRVAVTLVTWSGYDRQEQAVPWNFVFDQESARAFADAITAAPSPVPGWTSISGAIQYAARLLEALSIQTDRRVIDISGDGRNNDGPPVSGVRDAAVAAGITINGLPIVGVEPGLEAYYRKEVIGGPGAFLMVARDPESFARAVLSKLIEEIAGIGRGALAG